MSVQILEMEVMKMAHSDLNSPFVFVLKEEGAVHFSMDFHKVKAVSKFDAYPLPNIDTLLDWLGMAHFYLDLDLTKSCCRVPLSPKSKEVTAFSTCADLLEHYFSAPQYILYATAYLDEIVLCSNGWPWHKQHVSDTSRSYSKPSEGSYKVL